ncbi:hypothetical protein AM588_10008185 [Phytophthora nicotianae]|uniref:ATP-dependent DNA helicase n=1 Tax=Phytophthora nicotianae TaxID=4792 RepID=A0A0W8DR43_PHYNI|nr:hypothetical protein AM588_10008185 [Phytophthora nicotianae]
MVHTENSECLPLEMIIHGEGGSGNSWLIKHIVKDLHTVFNEQYLSRRRSKRVLLLAHQGTAAFNIRGQTICSALELKSCSRNAFSAPYKSLTTAKGGHTTLKRLQDKYQNVHLVIIDEISVISCGMLHWIDQRMREIWPKCRQLPFGGRDIIFTGDSAQLDTVIPYSLSTPSLKIHNSVQQLGRETWETIPYVCCLTNQNKGKADPEWHAAFIWLRQKCATPEDVDLFNTIYMKKAEMPEWVSTAKHIAYLNADVPMLTRTA